MEETFEKNKNSYALHIQSEISEIKSAEVYFFLHGVPSIAHKNEDIARAVTIHTKSDSVVSIYKGLGEAKKIGRFDFINSVKDSLEFAKKLAQDYKTVHLIGHSWGGCIALNIFRDALKPQKRGQIILLAPFTDFPKDGSIESWLIPMSKDGRIPLKVGSDRARENFFAVENLYPPKKDLEILPQNDNQFTIIEAIDDPDVPNEYTTGLLNTLKKSRRKIQIFRLEDDHLFSKNRENIINTVLESIDTYKFNKLFYLK